MEAVPPPIAVITPFPTETTFMSPVIYSALEVTSSFTSPSLSSYS